ncbi:MAG: hypothetical protein K0V04_33500 [Deltaproteobacteria bacterium]|nr:hypothetical protein [Deltaproteobacteria bacterium]
MTRLQTARARQWWVVMGVTGMLALAGCPGDDAGTADPTTSDPTGSSGVATTTGSNGEDTTAGSTSSDTTVGASTTDMESTGEASTGEASTGGEASCQVDPDPVQCTAPGYTGPGECDPYAQDCPAGQKCLPFDPDGQGVWDSTRCAPISANPGAEGDPCTMLAGGGAGGEDDCGLGLVCWDLVDDQGTCAEQCGCGQATPTCETEGQSCAGPYNQGAVAVCRDTCVPSDVDGCGPGQICAATPSGLFQCLNAGPNLELGEACSSPFSCAPGLLCAASATCPQAGNCCVEWCDAAMPEDCGGECILVFNGGAPHECYDDLGVCVGA